MRKDVFDLEKLNIYEDTDNYYFFRALEPGDFTDIDNNVITNSNGDVIRIRTDRERHGGDTKYNSSSTPSLEEVTDHIKIHYLQETNCISLTSNANTVLTYGRGYDKERYVIVKVPKGELGKEVFQAGPYMLEEIEKEIDKKLETYDDTVRQDYEEIFKRIDDIDTPQKLEALKEIFVKNGVISAEEKPVEDEDVFTNGLKVNITNSINYSALDDEANLEKNKIVLKLDLIKEQILPRISNRLLIQTVGGAFSSAELIHYDDISREELIDVPSEVVDVLSLLQQVPSTVSNIDEVKEKVLYAINNFNFLGHIEYGEYELSNSKLSIDNMYEVFGKGRVSYHEAKELYRKAYYLAKSRLRAIKSVELLDTILEGDSKYSQVLNYIKINGYGIEPEITTRASKNLVTVSESVSLDIGRDDIRLVNYINGLTEETLIGILDDPDMALRIFANNHFLDDFTRHGVNRDEYIAASLVDALDLRSYGVRLNLSNEQRRDIRDKLMEINLEELYDFYKSNGVLEKDMARIIFTNLIKGTRDIDTKEKFTLEELEWFIGYNKVKDTELNLLPYQRPIIGKIKEKYENKQFTAAVMPTGTGKTYISLAMMNEFEKLKNSLGQDSHAKILYLAPNNEILDQLKETIKKTYHPEEHLGEDIDTIIKRVFPNLVMTTYQNLKDRSSIGTGPDGKKELRLKDEFNQQFDFIVLDELHRTGADEWYSTVGSLLDSQGEDTKILGISATPERDVDFKDMTDFWARRYNYSEDELLLGEQMVFEMGLVEAIKLGYILEPRIINCDYSLISDGTLDNLELSIDALLDENVKKQELKKYEELRRNVENSDGIEKIIGENIKEGNKFLVFLPVTKREDGAYVDDDGEEIEGSKAEQIIKDYQTLFMQYLYADEYFKENKDVYNLYLKIASGVELDDKDREYLESEKNNLLLLSKIKISYKPSALNTKLEEMASVLINEMGWEPLGKEDLAQRLNKVMEDEVENYSMLGEYSNSRNKNELSRFRDSKSKKKKLMFVINKLNEGVHIGDVDGLVWLRPMSENSRILYEQQLGRCITANIPGKTKKRPVILDLVNNTLKVKLDRGKTQETRDLNSLKNLIDWMQVKNKVPDFNSSSTEEIEQAKVLRGLQRRYIKYFDEKTLFNEEKLFQEKNTKSIVIIKDILKRGSDIGLWDVSIPEEERVKNTNRSKSYSNDEDSIYGYLQLNAVSRNFLELMGEVENYEASELDKKFEEYYGYLWILKHREGMPTRLTAQDKLYVYEENGKTRVKVVKKPLTNEEGKPKFSYGETEQEWNNRNTLYYSNKVKAVGQWLDRYYYHQKFNGKLTQSQIDKLDELGCKKRPLDFQFEEYYGYLKWLHDDGQSTNLAVGDKLYVSKKENGEIEIEVVKKPLTNEQGEPMLSKGETEEKWKERYALYYSNKVKSVGYWLDEYYYNDRHKEKLTGDQKKDLDELRCKMSTFDFTFNQYLGYLNWLQNNNKPTNLASGDKLYVSKKENGDIDSIEVVKKPYGKNADDDTQKQKYATAQHDVGDWLYNNYENLDSTQQGELIKAGYTRGEEKRKKQASDVSKELLESILKDLGPDAKKEDIKCEMYYRLLDMAKKNNQPTNLSNKDKLYVYEDKDGKTVVEVVKDPGKNGTTTQKQKYAAAQHNVGNWLNRNYENLDSTQRGKLIEAGYTRGEELLKKKVIDETKVVLESILVEMGPGTKKEDAKCEMYYRLLDMAKKQGQPTNLTQGDKLYVYEDNGVTKVEVVKRPEGKYDTPTQKQKYALAQHYVGWWLYNNYAKLEPEQRGKLIEAGYTRGEELLKKQAQFAEAKDEFDANSTFTEVVEKINESTKSNTNNNTDTDGKGGQK